MGFKDAVGKKALPKARDYSNRVTTNNIQDNLKNKEEPSGQEEAPKVKLLNLNAAQYEERLRAANEHWEEALEVLPIMKDGTLGIMTPRQIFRTDVAYETWILNGMPDKLFKKDDEYIIVRVWVRKN